MKRAVAIALLAAMLLMCAACGESADISGAYKLISVNAGAYDWDLAESLSMLDDIILTVDGENATMTLPDDTVKLTLNLKEKTITDEKGYSSPYVCEDGRLTLEGGSSGSVLVFEKIVATSDKK